MTDVMVKVVCEWCKKTALVNINDKYSRSEFNFLWVYDTEHCICDDCYGRL
jgi:hypothetical protein